MKGVINMSTFADLIQEHIESQVLMQNIRPNCELNYKQQSQMVCNINATMIAVLMNEVSHKILFDIQQIVIDNVLVFVIEQCHDCLTATEATKIMANTMALKSLLYPYYVAKKEIDERKLNVDLSSDCKTLYVKFKL